jgi:nitric oxide dioxygenase
MTPQQIILIKDSFAKVVPISDRTADLFYARLFDIAPEVCPMFKGEIGTQGRKFMATLNVAVSGLERFDELKPALAALARQHAAFGVREEHYAPLGEALIWALEQGLGDDFTPETKEAWSGVYWAIAETMKAAAAKPTHA